MEEKRLRDIDRGLPNDDKGIASLPRRSEVDLGDNQRDESFRQSEVFQRISFHEDEDIVCATSNSGLVINTKFRPAGKV